MYHRARKIRLFDNGLSLNNFLHSWREGKKYFLKRIYSLETRIFYMIILMIFVSLCFANRFIVVEIVQFCSLTRMTIGWRVENRRQPGKRADTIPFITVTLYAFTFYTAARHGFFQFLLSAGKLLILMSKERVLWYIKVL